MNEKGDTHERFARNEWICPYMKYYRKRKVLCEGGNSPGVNPEHIAAFCKTFDWERCEIAQRLTAEYEGGGA